MKNPFSFSALIPVLVFLLSSPRSSHQQLEFTQPSYTPHVFVFEDAPIGHVLTTITDIAPQSAGRIVSIAYQGPDQAFYTSKVSGQPEWSVILNRTLDREAEILVTVVLQAQGQWSVDPTDFSFKLHVRDVNDNPPQFRNLPYNAEIGEDASLGTPVNVAIFATDKDSSAGGTVRYQLEEIGKDGQSTFIMDYETGHVTLNGSLDYESRTFYHYRVVAKDLGTPSLSSTTDLFITVKDVQNLPPVFVNIPYVASVVENSPVGLSVLTVRAVDRDRAIPNEVFYNITHSSCPGMFQVELNSGTIYVSSVLDRDVSPLEDLNGGCTIQLKATEITGQYPQKGNFTALATATIIVNDVNDNAPQFSSTSFSASLNENSPVGTPLQLDLGQQIIVTDIDQDANSEFRLSLSTDCLKVFPPTARREASVVISVSRPSCFDYEDRDHIDFEIFATGEGERNYTNSASVRLNIINTNDFTPRFNQSEYAKSIQENVKVSSPVITVEAVDADKPPFNALVYSIQGGDNTFSINSRTGEVSVARAQLDYETRQKYQLTVEATDSGGLRDSVPLTISLTDLNDNTPRFVRPQYQAFAAEGESSFRPGVTVKAEDADGTEKNRGVLYNLSPRSQWSSNFSVNASTGGLMLTSPLDYEALSTEDNGAISLVILATDQGTPPLSGSADVTVTVQDVNDERPVFTGVNYHGNVTENQGPDVLVTQVHATDGDKSAPNNQVFYVIGSGGNDQFQINSTSGAISTVTSLDRDRYSDYKLTVLAMDRGSPAFTATTTVNVIVNNINDAPPRFVYPQLTVSFPETTIQNATITYYNATDGDADAHLVYTILWSESQGLNDHQQPVTQAVLKKSFMLLGERLLTGIHGLDREQVESATLYLQVVDINADPTTVQTATGTVTIHVEDVDDNPPRFTEQSFSANITENSPRGTPLQFSIPISVTDVDKDENSIFALSLSNYSHCLEVLPSRARSEATVFIIVTDPKCFDYESRTVADFEVIAVGAGNGNFISSTSVHLTLININDESPTFTASLYRVSVPENVNMSYPITRVHADDSDSPPFNIIAYSLQCGGGRFSINSRTGEVSVARAQLDYETRQQYQLTVEATDNGGLRDSVPLTISLTDLNDNTPRFDRPEYQAFAVEGESSFRCGVTVKAEDADGTEKNRGVLYSLSPRSQWSSNFSVNASTGVLTLTSPLDYEALSESNGGTIHLIVLAIDQGTPQNTGSVNVIVTVQDVQDEAAVFTGVNNTHNVTENQGPGINVTENQGPGINVTKNEGPVQCQECRNIQCFTGPNPITCTADQPVCATRVTDSSDGYREVEKGCISRSVCEAWTPTDLESCLLVDRLVTGRDLECLFCCHGDLCNKGPNYIPKREDWIGKMQETLLIG